MTYLLVEEPAVEPVALSEAKTHLRVDHQADDGLIESLIVAARTHVERETGLAMIEQTWRLYLDDWPEDRCVRLRRHPVRRLERATIFDAEGVPHDVPSDWLRLDTVSRPGRVHVSDAAPSGASMNGIEIEFVAGLAESPPDVPDGLKRAVLLLVAQWYEFRGAIAVSDQPATVPAGFDRLIAPYRDTRV